MYPDDLALHNPNIYPDSTDLIMVQNPVAPINVSSELPNLTEHVPVGEDANFQKARETTANDVADENDAGAQDYEYCEIYVSSTGKKQRKKEPL
mmetsp:Transcript_31329/g.41477  ORF Transcript_31329/g.41477 Transcript_31329/m.41477 type:complete len:94 (-) Transcript_31329:1535-1816(-)